MKTMRITAVLAIAGVLLYAAAMPGVYRVERSVEIAAPPERIFKLITDFRARGSWSPWERLDPDMRRAFSGASSGVGAVYAWEGSKRVGAGRMEITDAVPPTKVFIKLDFHKPFESRGTAEYTLIPNGGSTTVTWAMYGPANYLTKVISVFRGMDAMLGKDFEKGLANLKQLAEKSR